MIFVVFAEGLTVPVMSRKSKQVCQDYILSKHFKPPTRTQILDFKCIQNYAFSCACGVGDLEFIKRYINVFKETKKQMVNHLFVSNTIDLAIKQKHTEAACLVLETCDVLDLMFLNVDGIVTHDQNQLSAFIAKLGSFRFPNGPILEILKQAVEIGNVVVFNNCIKHIPVTIKVITCMLDHIGDTSGCVLDLILNSNQFKISYSSIHNVIYFALGCDRISVIETIVKNWQWNNKETVSTLSHVIAWACEKHLISVYTTAYTLYLKQISLLPSNSMYYKPVEFDDDPTFRFAHEHYDMLNSVSLLENCDWILLKTAFAHNCSYLIERVTPRIVWTSTKIGVFVGLVNYAISHEQTDEKTLRLMLKMVVCSMRFNKTCAEMLSKITLKKDQHNLEYELTQIFTTKHTTTMNYLTQKLNIKSNLMCRMYGCVFQPNLW